MVISPERRKPKKQSKAAAQIIMLSKSVCAWSSVESGQYGGGHWKAEELPDPLFGFLRPDAAEHVMKVGHVADEGVAVCELNVKYRTADR